MEMVVNGVSTRKVARITEELCGTSFAKSTVSDLCKSLDPLVTAWNERDLSGERYPFVLVDALVLKVREGGRVRAVSALGATAVSEQGYREILGLQVGDSESERSWMSFFTWLKGRGLTGGVGSSRTTMAGWSTQSVSSFRAPPGNAARRICQPTLLMRHPKRCRRGYTLVCV
jgi:transposase-like protein